MNDIRDDERRERFYALQQEDDQDPEIQYQLACCYLDGDGTAPDREKGLIWLRLAAEGGRPEARARLEKEALPPLSRATLPQWLLRAEEGDAEALFQVADYGMAQGTSSPAECREYYERAARQGHREAWNSLGYHYFNGTIPAPGGEDPKKLAIDCYRNAAELGNPLAMHNLATNYFYGNGVEKDEAQSAFWREKQSIAAAEAGDLVSCEVAALDFYYGRNTPRSVSKALLCYQRLGETGREGAWRKELRLAEYAWEEDETRENALSLLLPLADGGNPWAEELLLILAGSGAMPELASRYRGETGEALLRRLRDLDLWGVLGDGAGREEFIALFFSGEEGDRARRQALLARILGETPWTGKLSARSVVSASYFLWSLLPAAADPPALSAETLWFWKNRARYGTGRDCYDLAVQGADRQVLSPEEARSWFEEAAGRGYAGAWNELGYRYDTGKLPAPGGAKAMAVDCYRKGAAAGDPIAMSNLATYLFLGEGTPKDEGEAALWRERQAAAAAAAGLPYWCERAGCDFLHGVCTPYSREAALRCFQALRGTRWEHLVPFREAEAAWDPKTGLRGAAGLLLPLADAGDQRAEETLAILSAAGASDLPALRRRYQGPEGLERLDRARLWEAGKEGDFFPGADARNAFFSCFPQADPAALGELAQKSAYTPSNRDPRRANLFLARLLPSLRGEGEKGGSAETIAGGLTKLRRGFASVLDSLGGKG